MGCGMPRDEALQFLCVGDGSECLIADAISAFEKGLIRHAFAQLNLILRKDPTVASAWREKARRYQSLRLHSAAERCWRRALALHADPFWDIALACALYDLGKHEEAIVVYDTLMEKTHDSKVLAIAHANRGNCHEALGNVTAAVSDYEAAIRRERSGVTHYLNYERVWARRKRWAEAGDVIARGLAVLADADAVPLLLEKARICNEQEQAELGLAAADGVLAFVPDQPRALYQRAWALGMLGRLDEAQSSLRRLLQIDPEDQDALKAIEKLEAVMPATHTHKPWWKFWS